VKAALIRVRLNGNRCPFDPPEAEITAANAMPNHVLVYSGPETDVEWETGESSCPGPFWQVHESSVRDAFGDCYDGYPPVYVCGHQVEVD